MTSRIQRRILCTDRMTAKKSAYKCWANFDWTIGNEFHWDLNQNSTTLFNLRIMFTNGDHFSHPRCVKNLMEMAAVSHGTLRRTREKTHKMPRNFLYVVVGTKRDAMYFAPNDKFPVHIMFRDISIFEWFPSIHRLNMEAFGSLNCNAAVSTLFVFTRISRYAGGRFKKTYELLNQRALKFSYVNKIHIFQCMGKIFCVEFQRYPLKFHTKYLTHTLKDMLFMQFWNFKSS